MIYDGTEKSHQVNMFFFLWKERKLYFYLRSNCFSDSKHNLIVIEYQISPTPLSKKVEKCPLFPKDTKKLGRANLHRKCVCGILL